MVEEWKTDTSYDMGLETERAAREKLQKQSIHHEEVKRHISYWTFSRVSLKKLSYSEQDTKAGFKKKKKKRKSVNIKREIEVVNTLKVECEAELSF